jgi:hypothetical protein
MCGMDGGATSGQLSRNSLAIQRQFHGDLFVSYGTQTLRSAGSKRSDWASCWVL